MINIQCHTFVPRVVETFMESNCFMALVPEMGMPAEVDTILRATAAKHKAESIVAFTVASHHFEFFLSVVASSF